MRTKGITCIMVCPDCGSTYELTKHQISRRMGLRCPPCGKQHGKDRMFHFMHRREPQVNARMKREHAAQRRSGISA